MCRSEEPLNHLFDVTWKLSGSGETGGQYLYRRTESCAHSPVQIEAVLGRLSGMSPEDLAALRDKLRRVGNGRRRFWGASAKCDLCRTLEQYAAE